VTAFQPNTGLFVIRRSSIRICSSLGGPFSPLPLVRMDEHSLRVLAFSLPRRNLSLPATPFPKRKASNHENQVIKQPSHNGPVPPSSTMRDLSISRLKLVWRVKVSFPIYGYFPLLDASSGEAVSFPPLAPFSSFSRATPLAGRVEIRSQFTVFPYGNGFLSSTSKM